MSDGRQFLTGKPKRDAAAVSTGNGMETCSRSSRQHAIPAEIERSHSTFLRDLPELLKSAEGRWVAYAGDRQIGFGSSKRELFRQCLEQGLGEREFVVCLIEPDVPSVSDDPVDLQ